MIDVDTSGVEKMFNNLIGSRDGKKAAKHACRAAQEVINKQTQDNAQNLKLKTSGKGWRKAIDKAGAFSYKMRRSRKTSFWHYSAVNYRKPILRITHLIENGFNHVAGRFVPGRFFRLKAFELKRRAALKMLEESLAYGYRQLSVGNSIPSYKQFRKRVRR